jgi:hypothetical protein
MERDYFKATNLTTGEEKFTTIPPAVQVIAKHKLEGVMEGDVRGGFYGAVFGSLLKDLMTDVAKGKVKPEQFFEKLTEWLWEWEPDIENVYDAEGNVVKPTESTEEAEDDPLP